MIRSSPDSRIAKRLPRLGNVSTASSAEIKLDEWVLLDSPSSHLRTHLTRMSSDTPGSSGELLPGETLRVVESDVYLDVVSSSRYAFSFSRTDLIKGTLLLTNYRLKFVPEEPPPSRTPFELTLEAPLAAVANVVQIPFKNADTTTIRSVFDVYTKNHRRLKLGCVGSGDVVRRLRRIALRFAQATYMEEPMTESVASLSVNWSRRAPSRTGVVSSDEETLLPRLVYGLRNASTNSVARARPRYLNDYDRLGLTETSSLFRCCESNSTYRVCPSYPSSFIVPSSFSDSDVSRVASYRVRGRLPAVTFKMGNAVLARASQPLTGITRTRCPEDEKLLELMSPEAPPKIIDLRKQTSALANLAVGGGFEQSAHYRNAELSFLGLDNIHAVRTSYRKLVDALHELSDDGVGKTAHQVDNKIEASGWPQVVRCALEAAVDVAETLSNGTSVLVHCSDGWDRTPLVSSLAQILLDPHYRTFQGFEDLIEKEFFAFGHPFAQRSGSSFLNLGQDLTKSGWIEEGVGATSQTESFSPVFVQFVDCVYQLTRQFPRKFEFSQDYLASLLHYSYSGRFEVFLKDSEKERNHADFGGVQELWMALRRCGGSKNLLFANCDDTLFASVRPRDNSLFEKFFNARGVVGKNSDGALSVVGDLVATNVALERKIRELQAQVESLSSAVS